MCRLIKPITYYCDDDQVFPPHIYLDPNPEQWEGCLNHHNVDLRGEVFSAPERTCYDVPDQAPLARSICPDCYSEWGAERTAIINAHVKAILQRMDDLCGLFNNPSKLKAVMRSSCHLVLDFAMHLEMPTPDENYSQYLSPPKDTGTCGDSSEHLPITIMCIAENTTKFICDDSLSTSHRYAHIQEWTGYFNHPIERFRGREFQEDIYLKPCSYTPPVPIATNLCPDYLASLGESYSDIILSYVSRIMYRIAEVTQYPLESEEVQCELEGVYRHLRRYDFYKFLKPAQLGERYINNELPARDPKHGLPYVHTSESTQFSSQLRHVYLQELFHEAKQRRKYKGGPGGRTNSMRKLFYQIAGVEIEVARLRVESMREEDDRERLEEEERQRVEAAKTPEQRLEDDSERQWRARQAEESYRPKQITQYSRQNLYIPQAAGTSRARRFETPRRRRQ
ncbi:hypothetical protein BOTNAR_0362g00040 [Botryotinia narcissicola]|uniref:Uncharacterized protein n=1 Tax=Botryotinia narcissicola TaxID=278944 RepID=A0A4Z1HXX5_9HELO|nr:hypothetical protein BOTNAR_0362g00040 [Botryotinia narcissicola]